MVKQVLEPIITATGDIQQKNVFLSYIMWPDIQEEMYSNCYSTYCASQNHSSTCHLQT